MDFLKRNFVFISVVIGTLLLLFGGVFFFSKNSNTKPKAVDSSILLPEGEYIAGGISNGVYQPRSTEAKVTLVEFGDYQCPACGSYNPIVQQALKDFNGKINYAFRNFPLSQHSNAKISSYAAEAAGLQGKFWEMHDKLYETQSEWSSSSDAKSIFVGYAKGLGLNTSQFESDLTSTKVTDKVSNDQADGSLVGINQTPTFFINGVKADLAGSYDQFKSMIDAAIKDAPLPSASPEAYHAHFDIAVYINDKKVDLSQSKYQSTENDELDPYIHLHDGNGKVVHVHKQGVPLIELFSSIKLSFPENSSTNSLKVYVNGKLNDQTLAYVPKDLDQILVSYGPISDKLTSNQIASVTNDSCIYSLKCPERGTPPPESCAGGLGTGCSD